MQKRNFYIFITIVITLYLQSGCGTAPARETNASTADHMPVGETLVEAEKLFAAREDISKLRDALALLSNRRGDTRIFDIEWTYSKYSLFLGQRLTDKAERQKVFEGGINAGQIARRLEPNRPEGHFWYAANLGELAKMSPVSVGYESIDDIRNSLNKVVELDPTYQGASVYDALGQLELETKLFGGKSEKAVEYFEKGVSLARDNSNLRLHLGEAYLLIGKKEQAKQQLEHLITMKSDPEFLFEHKKNIGEAERLLKTRF